MIILIFVINLIIIVISVLIIKKSNTNYDNLNILNKINNNTNFSINNN